MSFFAHGGLTPLLAAAEIEARVATLGREIGADYAARAADLVLVSILKGSVVFFADLARRIDLPITVDFIGLSSYRDATASSGTVQMTQDLSSPIEGKHVLVVEDIVDSGLTMRTLLDLLAAKRPASLKLAALLDRPARRQVPITIDYLGFTIEDHFVVGYGLDFQGKYRNLPFIAVLDAITEPSPRAGA